MTDEIEHEALAYAKRCAPLTEKRNNYGQVTLLKQRLIETKWTEKEKEILRAYERFFTRDWHVFRTLDILSILDLKMTTYKFHMTNIYKKLGFENVAHDDKKIVLVQILFIINSDLEIKKELYN